MPIVLQQPDPLILAGFAAALVVCFLVFLVMWPLCLGLWLQGRFSGVQVGIVDVLAMRLRKVDPAQIVTGLITASQAGVRLDRQELEAHLLAGGRPLRVVRALVAAHRARIDLSFREATAIDLAGRDVLEAVRVSVYPIIIDCPEGSHESGEMLTALALDGVEIMVRARVTVRSNLQGLIGGAAEETIIARVGQGIVSAVGSMKSHLDVLENPDNISRKVLESGLDTGTAFAVLSVDVVDVEVGRNIGAHLHADQAEADKDVAQAKAEERRAMAVSTEREFIAKIRENEATVVLAQAEIPQAVSQSLRDGTMDVHSYFKMLNVRADTRMREKISGRPLRAISAGTTSTDSL